ncbi:MAG TPA: arylsulfotransferase family protein [Solirubrobacteraceae bacterium]|nr:arylsulfotransferase family protein [Solirubrobacteraceae bacterium]
MAATVGSTPTDVNAVSVSPFPGTLDASPTTQISFLGASGTRVSDVVAVGSASGTHAGKLKRYSTGTGESFLPQTRFVPGESVRVTAKVITAGHAATVRTNFTIAFNAPVPQAAFPKHRGSPHAVQHYLSAPALTPSAVQITTPPKPGAAPGDLFLAPYEGTGRPGPMIVDQTGQLVWFHPLPAGESATNLHPQTYRNKKVLTWWQGHILKIGFGQGEDEIYDTSYRPIATVSAGNGYHADLHEFRLTPQGTAWIDAFDPVYVNLSSVGGLRHGVLTDSVVEEIDVKTGLVMWEWHALGHIPLRDSYTPVPHIPSHYWDFVHINSIDPGPDGQLLLSSRSTSTIFDVDMRSGGFRWRIGGKYSSFNRGPGTFFFYQHDATWEPGGLVSVFDNGATPPREAQSRGLLLDPNTQTKAVTLVKAYINPNKTLLATSQGSLTKLSNGNWLMGYGGLPNFTEYDSSGDVLLDGTLGHNVQNYRTYLAHWSGHPTTRPKIAAQAAGGTATVNASWNGATRVAAWQVLGGADKRSLTPIATTPTSGFETAIAIHSSPTYVAVAALDAAGHRLSTSHAIALSD